MVKCVFLIHEGSLDHTRVYAKMTWMGTGHVGKTNHVIRGPLEALSHVLSAQPPTSGGREIEFNHVANESISHTYAMKSQ